MPVICAICKRRARRIWQSGDGVQRIDHGREAIVAGYHDLVTAGIEYHMPIEARCRVVRNLVLTWGDKDWCWWNNGVVLAGDVCDHIGIGPVGGNERVAGFRRRDGAGPIF